jgi:hypothetical protein
LWWRRLPISPGMAARDTRATWALINA